MANGRVTTGFSKPYVALYSVVNGVITYSNAMPLARGVDVNVSPETSDDNRFYADNEIAESTDGTLTGGTVNLTVDGLKTAAERLIYGLPTPVDNWTAYGDSVSIPYVGFGYIARTMEEGNTRYVPTILTKLKFIMGEDNAATQDGEEIDWQTTSLSATIFRGDDSNHVWKFKSSVDYETEAAAEAALVAKLGGSFTVTYDANGGTGLMTDSKSTYNSGSTVTVLSNSFTAPEGEVFSSWNTAADGTGIEYDPADTFTISGQTTLYAQWVSAY